MPLQLAELEGAGEGPEEDHFSPPSFFTSMLDSQETPPNTHPTDRGEKLFDLREVLKILSPKDKMSLDRNSSFT